MGVWAICDLGRVISVVSGEKTPSVNKTRDLRYCRHLNYETIMIDQEVQKTNEAWEIEVRTPPGGRCKWPEAIKVKAADRIYAGKKITNIAIEIGTDPSLMAEWVSAILAKKTVPAFVELARPETTDEERIAAAEPASITACQIHIGDIDITIPPGNPTNQLTEVLRAVRDSQ